MKYNKQNLQIVVEQALNAKIEDVFYASDSEFNSVKEIAEIPSLGILMYFSSGLILNFVPTDYSPYYNLGGIDVTETADPDLYRPLQTQGNYWQQYRNSAIKQVEILENEYTVNHQHLIVPFGLRFTFDNHSVLYLLNLSIEDYDPLIGTYEFSRGGEIVLFFSENAIAKHEILKTISFKY